MFDHFLARLTKSRGSYCRTPGVCRRRCRRRRRRPHLVKVCLQALIISINLTIPWQQIRSKIESFQNANFLISQPNPMA